MKRGLLFCIMCAMTCTLSAQKKEFTWVEPTHSDQGNAPSVVSSAMVVKPNGDLYLTGSNGLIGGGITFGQPCLAKYGSNGMPKWVTYFPDGNNSGTGTEWLVEDANGDLIAMYYGSELDFNGTPTPTSPKYVIVKFDTTGTALWVNYFGGNQINVKAMDVSADGNVAVMIGAQFVSTEDTTVSPGNSDVLVVLNGSDGAFDLVDISAVTPTNAYHVFNNMYPHGSNSMVCISTEPSTFSPIRTYISEVNLATNTVVSKDTVENIFHTSTINVQSGDVMDILDFDPATRIAYVYGRAHMSGIGVGVDSIFGVNPSNQSMFLAKMDFNTGEVLNHVVYYTPGVQEGVQRAIRGENEITFMVVYRDTLRNTSSGDEFTSIDTLPNNGPHPHTLIQNFTLDLELNYYNQTARVGAFSNCTAGGYDANGSLYLLYDGGSNQYFDNYFLNVMERTVFAKIGGTAVGVERADVSDQVTVFPNPADDRIFIQSDRPIQSLRMFNMNGQQVPIKDYRLDQISVEHLKSGIYILEATSDHTTWIERIVIR